MAHQKAHDPGHAVAVAKQGVVVRVGDVLHVHAHAREELGRVLAGDRAAPHDLLKGLEHQGLGAFSEAPEAAWRGVDDVELFLEALERCGNLLGRGLVDGVVDVTAPGVHHRRLVSAAPGEQLRGKREALRVRLEAGAAAADGVIPEDGHAGAARGEQAGAHPRNL